MSILDRFGKGILPMATLMKEAQEVGINLSEKDIEIILLLFSTKDSDPVIREIYHE